MKPGGWSSIQDVLGVLPGPTVEGTQSALFRSEFLFLLLEIYLRFINLNKQRHFFIYLLTLNINYYYCNNYCNNNYSESKNLRLLQF